MADDDFRAHMMNTKREEVSSETARAVRWLGYATGALIAVVVLAIVIGITIWQREQETRARAQDSLLREQRKAIEYLCETVTVMDLIIVQESQFLRRSAGKVGLGPNEKELLRERLATLEAAHLELTDQRACRGI